jgi:hemolysin III
MPDVASTSQSHILPVRGLGYSVRMQNRRTTYSRAETISDATVHVAGTALALAAVPVLITMTAFLRPDIPAIIGTSVYGATLIAMLLCSALYNMFSAPGWNGVLRRLDHSAIYVKIAGTFTAFCLLSEATDIPLIIFMWTAALAGVALKIAAPQRFRWLGFGLYLGMGWFGALAGRSLFAAMTTPVLSLVVTGGLLYTVGTLFYLRDAMPYHRTIWHVFVLAASAVFFAAITTHIIVTA